MPFDDATLSDARAMALAARTDLDAMMREAAALRDAGFGDRVTYSRKVFIPLTQACRDSCRYCTFARHPRRGQSLFMTPNEVLAVAAAGAAAGCREALFTLGDKPELRYRAAREELAALGHASTLDYLAVMAGLVLRETGLLPHLNAGVMDRAALARLRGVSVSQGLMLETASARLSQRGMPHFGSPDKLPARRLETIAAAGEAAVPFTSGLLIGIGETRAERIEALLALRALLARHGHIQEVIIQNFRGKPGTRMAAAAEPTLEEHLWTVAAARLLFGPAMSIQAPPNLQPYGLVHLIEAGINDWGGVSPVTPDHVNPEAPWPHLDDLASATAAAGKMLVERLAVYPAQVHAAGRWIDRSVRPHLLRQADGEGLARVDAWVPGGGAPPPAAAHRGATAAGREAVAGILEHACGGEALDEAQIMRLFAARGGEFDMVCEAADALRARMCGDTVSYVVTRNINYTNICTFRCSFCAFSKGKLSADLRGRPYDLDSAEIERRTEEAWARGATEICLQGGIHPEYTGRTYLEICARVKRAAPGVHVHAFSPLEVWQGAASLGLSLHDFLSRLRATGLGSLPGTAAEILDDEVRALICPDKITTGQWFEVMQAAHEVGLRSTATIMFGHVDRYEHWARHLLRLRTQQTRTGGFTEFVPLPFVPTETPMYLKGTARRGPTWREAVLMHAVGRLALHPLIPNIQTSWVKMGPEGAALCLRAGANDLGGTLMNEAITRAAGAQHGQEMPPDTMEATIRAIGRVPRQRTTLYADPPAARRLASLQAAPLEEVVNTPVRHHKSANFALPDATA